VPEKLTVQSTGQDERCIFHANLIADAHESPRKGRDEQSWRLFVVWKLLKLLINLGGYSFRPRLETCSDVSFRSTQMKQFAEDFVVSREMAAGVDGFAEISLSCTSVKAHFGLFILSRYRPRRRRIVLFCVIDFFAVWKCLGRVRCTKSS